MNHFGAIPIAAPNRNAGDLPFSGMGKESQSPERGFIVMRKRS